jgi:shikimate dehydrogenase
VTPDAPGATTRVFCLLGDPVEHSLSPVFQNAAMRAAGLDAVYVALRCDASSVAPLIRALARAGGGGNVTVPHKAIAAECIQRPTPVVMRTGVCNTFWGVDGVVHGDNTDVAGFRYAASQLVPSLEGVSALLIGSGGAAAAAVCGLIGARAASITLINRSPDRARALAARFDEERRTIRVVSSMRELDRARFDLVVNATSLGLRDDDPLPLDLSALDGAGAVFDLVYRRDQATAWVRSARRLGITATDGTEMLLGQGAAAFEHWFGIRPSLDLLRAAVGGVTPATGPRQHA